MAAHRYWRIFPTATYAAAQFIELYEFELHTAIGGSTVTGSGTAIDSTNYSGYPASAAFDASLTTYWCSALIDSGQHNANNDWCGYDFGVGNSFDIIEVKMYTPPSYGPVLSGFTIDYSDDGATWTTKKTVLDGSWSPTPSTWFTFATPNPPSVSSPVAALAGY